MKPILNPSAMLIQNDKDISELKMVIRTLKSKVRILEENAGLAAAGTSALELEGLK